MMTAPDIAKVLDEAECDEMKKRFAALCDNLASGEALDASLGMFAKGLRQIIEARTAAQAVVDKLKI
jgi:hypothetical protein